jgi:exonuclease SbcD
VSNQEHIRYCSSPISMGFGEIKQQKVILSIEFKGQQVQVTSIPVPQFQKLA